MSATLPPPRGSNAILPAAFIMGFALALMGPAARPARADEPALLGFRIALTACHGTTCRDVPARVAVPPIGGRYACQTRAATLEAAAAAMPAPRRVALGLPGPDWTIKARCTAITGGARA